MGEFLEYGEVVQELRGAMNPGKLKLQSSNIFFKNLKTGKLDQFAATDVEEAHWLVRARGYCLKIVMNGGNIQRYDGFRESDFEKLSAFIQKNYNTSLLKKDLSLRGWNWGVADFIGKTLDFRVEGETAFELPMVNVSRCASAKNEVTIEFTPNDDAAVSLVELRFHVPADVTSEDDRAQELCDGINARANVLEVVGDAITSFSEVQCLTPRGRYDIKIYPGFLQLHGKTFDYKIEYTSILRLFLLPHRDGRQMYFVVSLDPPIKQGQTRYHFLILLFNKETETTLELSLSDEELEQKYENKLKRSMSGPEFEIISRIMKVLVNKKITVPGSFVGHSGTQSIGCSYKAATGYLYPLERGFIFVHKPPLHIRFDEIEAVNFARSAGNTRSFDFDIDTKIQSHTFVGIEKDEYGKLYDFVTQKKLRVKNIGARMDAVSTMTYVDDMLPSDDEDQEDAYMRRMKLEGKERHEGGNEDDDDDDDESDEDFKPDGSASEPDDEYDSNPESTSDSDSGSKSSKGRGGGSASESGADSDEKMDEGAKVEKKVKEKKVKEKKPKREEKKPRKKKQKKERDADKPKRPQSAYFLWLNENRAKIKEEFPGISITDVSKKAGERWKEVKDKSKWEALANKEKEQYEKMMTEWKKKQKERPPGSPESSPKKKPKKSPTKETTSGSGAAYKSKEFISDNEASSASEDSDDKPLKQTKKDDSDSEVGELPEDEAILSTPPSSGKGSDDESD